MLRSNPGADPGPEAKSEAAFTPPRFLSHPLRFWRNAINLIKKTLSLGHFT